MDKTVLAYYGGDPVRTRPMPPRRQFGIPEFEAVKRTFEDSWQRGVDFSFQGHQEAAYTREFCDFQGGGGYADAVATGTLANYAAIKALNLPSGSDIVVSPITDPGSITPAILSGHRISVADAQKDDYNIGPEEFDRAVTPNTRAAILTHLGGRPAAMDQIVEIAEQKGIRVIEDCSQAHGALQNGIRVGNFGTLSFFSTMYSKIHSTGGCGGLIYTREEDLYWSIRAWADRGKPFHSEAFQPKNPTDFLFPAMNINLDELSCAIGRSTLSKLQKTIERRVDIIRCIDEGIRDCKAVYPFKLPKNIFPSPFFHTVRVRTNRLSIPKTTFAEAVRAEGVDINPDYRYVVSEWKWIQPHLVRPGDTPGARRFRDSSFNILFHEKYADEDVADVIEGIRKVDEVLTS
jgi:perosamine synthetase